jgi:hypothetical protein
VSDDGVGGAAPGSGSGLIGLVDRVEALGGKLSIDSPVGQGTMLSIELPLTSPPAVQEGRWLQMTMRDAGPHHCLRLKRHTLGERRSPSCPKLPDDWRSA